MGGADDERLTRLLYSRRPRGLAYPINAGAATAAKTPGVRPQLRRAMDTWWIAQPYLVGGSNPTATELEALRLEGCRVLVSFLKEDEQAPRYDVARVEAMGFVRHNIPVKDFHLSTVDRMKQFIRLIDKLPAGVKAIVHCEGGTGRTRTFAAAYWIAKGMAAGDAIAHVRKARPRAVETPEQQAALEQFARAEYCLTAGLSGPARRRPLSLGDEPPGRRSAPPHCARAARPGPPC